MTCHPLVFQLIQLGQHTTYENSEPFCELMRTYLQEEPNERLQQAVRSMELWHTKDTSSYFYPAHFAAMDELYRLANFTPAYVLAYAKHLLPDDPYLNYIKELAMRFEPKPVKIEDWSPSHCPTCGTELSTHHGDGYFTHPTFMEHCPHCQQALKWPN